MKRIKSGDTVIVIAGKSIGHIGKVLKVKEDNVVVEGANIATHYVKKNPQQPEQSSGLIAKEAPLHVSNVALYNADTKKAGKVGFKILENGRKVRYFKSNGELVDRV